MVTTDSLLGQLPTAPSDDAFGEVSDTLAAFARKFGQFLKGTPGVDGLLQSIRHARTEFKRAVRATAPDFRACERSEVGMLSGKATTLDFLKGEEKESIPANGERAIYIEDVMERARK